MVDNAEFRNRVEEEDAGHTCVPNIVLLDSRIAPMTRLCYSVIKSYAYGKKNDARPGQKTLAEQLGVKDRMVRHYLTELEVLGLISIEQRGHGKTNIYWLEPLTGVEDRIQKYVEWLQKKKVERQPVTGHERQPVTAMTGNTLPVMSGNPLPTNKTSITQKKTREEKAKTPPPLSRVALSNTEQNADTTVAEVLLPTLTPSLEVSPPPEPPKGYLWLYSSVSNASMHLIEDRKKQTNYQQQHTLCDTGVQHRTPYSPGLQCVNRPCQECLRIARETSLIVFALEHITGADVNLNRRDVMELAHDLLDGRYVAEDVARYEAIWRKGWQWRDNPGQKPTLDWVRKNIASVKSDIGESKYEAAQELRMRIRELRSGQPVADRRLAAFKDEDDVVLIASGGDFRKDG